MFKFIFFTFYFIILFFILIGISICSPRLGKTNKKTPYYIYIGFYIINTVMLNFGLSFNPLKTLLFNILYLFFSNLIGSKFRLLGLTGQICSGKTTVAKYLQNEYNAVIINMDDLNREVLTQENVKKSIRKVFGDQVFDEKNELNKMELRKIIFSDMKKRKQLEQITHLKVFILFFKTIFNEKIMKGNKLVFVENAILLRFALLKYICYPILSICTNKKEDLVTRIMKRDKCDKEIAENILKNQLTLEEFTKQSDYVIYNDSDLSFLTDQVDKYMIKLSINDD